MFDFAADKFDKRIANSKLKADDALLDFVESLHDCGYGLTDLNIEELKKFIEDYCSYVLQNRWLPADRVNESNKHLKQMQSWDNSSQFYFLAYVSALLVLKRKTN